MKSNGSSKIDVSRAFRCNLFAPQSPKGEWQKVFPLQSRLVNLGFYYYHQL